MRPPAHSRSIRPTSVWWFLFTLQVLEVYRLVALATSVWRRLAVPVLFLVFWLTLFTLQVYAFLTSSSSGILVSQQGLLFVLLSR